MIQRIQTVWLFLASLAIFALFLFPYLQFLSLDGAPKVIKVTGVYENIAGQVVQTQGFTGLTIGAVILGLIPLAVIFYYRERKRQISLCYVAIGAILIYSFWMVKSARTIVGSMQMEFQNYGLGVILPSLAILFVILALKGIRHDEKLIRSADRLR